MCRKWPRLCITCGRCSPLTPIVCNETRGGIYSLPWLVPCLSRGWLGPEWTWIRARLYTSAPLSSDSPGELAALSFAPVPLYRPTSVHRRNWINYRRTDWWTDEQTDMTDRFTLHPLMRSGIPHAYPPHTQTEHTPPVHNTDTVITTSRLSFSKTNLLKSAEVASQLFLLRLCILLSEDLTR